MSAVIMRPNGFKKRSSYVTSNEQTSVLKPLAKKPRLPLKKRFYIEENEKSKPENESHTFLPAESLEPVDFSLPNRYRAKITPEKEKHSDTESDRLSESDSIKCSPTVSGLDLSWIKKTNFPTDLPVTPPTPSKNSAFTPTHVLQRTATSLPSQILPTDLLRLASLSGFSLPLLPALNPALPLYGTTLTPPIEPGRIASTSASNDGQTLLVSPSSEGPFEHSPPVSSNVYVINPATGNKVRRNYKNMTRERRMEANARERTRVHTIGAAFEDLRHLVPSLAPDQKLSKLSMLRISCKYIMLLASMNGKDYSADQRNYSVEECVEMLNDTIISESKAKRLDR